MTTPSSRTLYLRLLSYVRPYAKVFTLGVLGMVLAAATEPLFPAMIKPLLDQGFGAKGPSAPPLLFAGAIVGIFLVRGILTFTSSYLMNWVSSRVVLDLRRGMFDRLLKLPARFYDDHTSGSLLSKVAYDVQNVSGAATFVLTVLVRDSIAVIGLLAWLFYLNWKLTLITLAIAPPIALTVRLIAARLRHMARGAQRVMGDLVHVLQEAIECHKVVKVYGGDAYEAQRFLKTAQNLRGFLVRGEMAAALTTPITHVLAATSVAVIIYLAMQGILVTRATVGDFASFMTAMLMLLAPIKHLAEINPHIQRGLAAAESVFGLMERRRGEETATLAFGGRAGRGPSEAGTSVYRTPGNPPLAATSRPIRPAERPRLAGPP